MNKFDEIWNFIKRILFKPSDKDPGFTILTKVLWAGLASIYLVSCIISTTGKWYLSLGYALIVTFAALMCGGVLGFLFGIPRSVQKAQPNNTNSTNGDNEKFEDNTNLEQISDWLTKIIVGVSLTQAREIQTEFVKTANNVASGFCASDYADLTYPFACSVLIFAIVVGFLYSYLWTRTILKRAFNDDDVKKIVDERLSSKENPMSQEIEAIKQSQLNKVKKILTLAEADPNFSVIINTAKPLQPTNYEDCQSGRWGGLSENNGRTIVLKEITPNPDGNTFHIKISVKGSGLVDPVYFMLHDTYDPVIQKQDPVNEEAIIEIDSYEAFTIAAVCDNGNTKLELNLNNQPNIPTDYKYIPTN